MKIQEKLLVNKHFSRAILVLAFVLVTQLSNAQKLVGVLCKPVIEMDNKLYPSYVWANSTRNYLTSDTKDEDRTYFGDSEGQFGVDITYLKLGSATVKVVIECPQIMQTSSYTAFLNGKHTEYEIFPEIAYKWDYLSTVTQPFPANVTFTVYANEQLIMQATKVITVRSVNDCPFAFVHRTGIIHDMNFMYAAYVNEHHPVITNELLPQIMRTGIINSIAGYQSNDTKEVFRQVFSVWHNLRQRGLKYSSLSSSNNSPSYTSPLTLHQFVRMPSESLRSQQANCVDGTVLFASILYRMSIHPLITVTPSHCWLGFYGDESHKQVFFLETTLVGTQVPAQNLQQVTQLDIYDKTLDQLYGDSYRTFLLAIQIGLQNYNEHKDKFLTNLTNSLFSKDVPIASLQYQLFEIDKYRKEGLLPIKSY